MAMIGDVIKSFDGSDELMQTQKQALEALSALGNAKAELFKKEIQESLTSAGNGTNLTIPVSAVLRSTSDVRAYSAIDASKIGDVVEKSVNLFINGSSGDIVKGVTSLITGALDVLLGASSGSEGHVEEYYVATEGISIVRLDLKAWYINISASSIQKRVEKITAVVVVKSIVNLAKIDFATFLNLYQQQLFAANIGGAQLQKALQDARGIYTDFNKIQNNSKMVLNEQPLLHSPPAAQKLLK